MTISDFLQTVPAALQPIIQDKKAAIIVASLTPELGFRQIADSIPLPVGIGDSYSTFKDSLIAPNDTPLPASTFQSNLDNGMSPKTIAVEQITFTPRLYGDTMDLKLYDNVAQLVPQYVRNLKAQAQQAEASIDKRAQRVLIGNYSGGETFCTATVGSDTSIAVDDVTGFETKMVNGVPTAVSGSVALAIVIGATANTVTGVSVDATNTSRKPFGRSGVLTLGTARADTAGDIVKANDRPIMIRPYSSGTMRADMVAIQTGDLLTFKMLRAAKTQLINNSVPMIDGAYNVYCAQDSLDQLFADTEFLSAFQGTGRQEVYGTGTVSTVMGLRFITNNVHLTQAAGTAPTTVLLHFPIMVGAGALTEGDYIGTAGLMNAAGGVENFALHNITSMNKIDFIERSPMDRLGISLAQSWKYVGDFVVPTDSLVTSAVLPTASSARLKRAVVMPHSA
jgi:hypothetical protein